MHCCDTTRVPAVSVTQSSRTARLKALRSQPLQINFNFLLSVKLSGESPVIAGSSCHVHF